MIVYMERIMITFVLCIALLVPNIGVDGNENAVHVRKKRGVQGWKYDWTNDEIKVILEVHNQARRNMTTASNMQLMTWNEALSATAQAYSCKCTTTHNPDRHNQSGGVDVFPQSVGENIFAKGWPGDPVYDAVEFPTTAVNTWYLEIENFYFQDDDTQAECNGTNGGFNGGSCLHFTQVVWSDTNEVGCGISQCETLADLFDYNGFLVVCNYARAGNINGYAPWIDGTQCGNCPAGIGTCVNGLCAPDSGVCGDLTCSNGGTMDTASCVCDCASGFVGAYCDRLEADFDDTWMTCNEPSADFTIIEVADVTECQTECTNNPTCMAYRYPNDDGDCDIHTSKTAYIPAIAYDVDSVASVSGYYYLDSTDQMWNYVGLDIGCGSTYFADMQGTDGFEVTAANRWSCWYQCMQYPRCQGWDWSDTDGLCNLLSFPGIQAPTASTGWEHHTIICPVEPFASFTSGWGYYPMFLVKGGKLQNGKMTFIACQELCAGVSDCAAVDWDVDKHRCWIHTSSKKDSSCSNSPIGSRNTYHMKKTICSDADYPAPLFTIP